LPIICGFWTWERKYLKQLSNCLNTAAAGAAAALMQQQKIQRRTIQAVAAAAAPQRVWLCRTTPGE